MVSERQVIDEVLEFESRPPMSLQLKYPAYRGQSENWAYWQSTRQDYWDYLSVICKLRPYLSHYTLDVQNGKLWILVPRRVENYEENAI